MPIDIYEVQNDPRRLVEAMQQISAEQLEQAQQLKNLLERVKVLEQANQDEEQ